jgi:hypothetical protein
MQQEHVRGAHTQGVQIKTVTLLIRSVTKAWFFIFSFQTSLNFWGRRVTNAWFFSSVKKCSSNAWFFMF